MRVKCREKKRIALKITITGVERSTAFPVHSDTIFVELVFSHHTHLFHCCLFHLCRISMLCTHCSWWAMFALSSISTAPTSATQSTRVESSSYSCSSISNSLIVRLSLSLTYCDGANNLNIGTTFVPNSRSIHIGMQHIECQEITHNSPQSDYIFYLNWQASTFFQITTLFDRRNRLALWILHWIALDCGIIVTVRVGRWSFQNPLVVIFFLFVWQHPWTVKKSRTEGCCFQSRSEMDLNSCLFCLWNMRIGNIAVIRVEKTSEVFSIHIQLSTLTSLYLVWMLATL